MNFIFHQFIQLGMVAVIMMCSLMGTIGIIKLIKFVFHTDKIGRFDPKHNNEKKQNRNQVNNSSK